MYGAVRLILSASASISIPPMKTSPALGSRFRDFMGVFNAWCILLAGKLDVDFRREGREGRVRLMEVHVVVAIGIDGHREVLDLLAQSG